MMTITRPQADATATLIKALRPEWDIPGIVKALGLARDRGTEFEVIHAALYAAEDLSNRTPAIIALRGPHWTRGRELGSSNPRGEKCDQPGHEGKPAHNCSYCIADSKARDDDTPAPPVVEAGDHEDQDDINARGIRRIRAALGQATS